jgi:hypothetical protein
VVTALERALGIDQDVCDVLNVADLPFAASDFEQGIVGGALYVGRIEHEYAAELGAPTRGQRPILTFDVVDDRRAWPSE